MPLALNVPWYQNRQIRETDAQWDALNKTWYVPDDFCEEYHRYEKWFPLKRPDLIIPGGPILISSPADCPHCDKKTTVFGLGTDGGYTKPIWPPSEDWVYDFQWGFISSIKDMDNRIQTLLKKECPNFYKDNDMYGGRYWINHCDRCGHQISDELLYTFDETGLFCPPDSASAKNISIKNIEMDFFTCYKASRNGYWDMHYLYMWRG